MVSKMFFRNCRISALLVFVLFIQIGTAAVTAAKITERTAVLDGAAFGKAGPYERIVGKAMFAVDPKRAANEGIFDLTLAPQNKDGLVEFSADIYILRPRDAARGNGTALVEISNRGNKLLLPVFDFAKGSSMHPQTAAGFGDRFLLEQGFTLVWIGWEFDVPKKPYALRLDAPVATEQGKTITGLIRSEWIGSKPVKTISLGDRTQIGYAVADPDDPANVMYVRDRVDAPRAKVPGAAWKFSGESYVTMLEGFTPGRIYEIVYRAKNPVVAGVGFAAVRDFVSYLKHGDAKTDLGEQGSSLKRALGFGISQDGRWLRHFLYEGFNADEKGRMVFDGVWAHVGGAGRGNFNARFAQPSRDGQPFMNVLYPVDIPPFTDQELLAKERASGTVPKLFLSNSSHEYWGRCASLTHTTSDGKSDVSPLSSTRIYFIAGSQHSAGSLPPRRIQAQNPANVNDYLPTLRALLVAMQGWIAEGKEPPASRYPLIRSGELVPLSHFRFPEIPGVRVAQRKREAYRLDFSVEPVKFSSPYVTLVPQVDADGNEIAGIRLPEVAVPLATHTGWNLRSEAIGAPEELYSLTGSYIPFVATKKERFEKKDPRLSVEERYSSEEDYLNRVKAVAQSLAQEGYLLERDLPRIQKSAREEWRLQLGEKERSEKRDR